MRAEFQRGFNPGMMIRLDESAVDEFRKAMVDFFPHYFNIDLQLPENYQYELCTMLGFCVDFTWDHITYSTANLDVKDIKIDFIRDSRGGS